MSNKSGTSSQIISLPQGGGALKGIGAKFSPDLFTGTGTGNGSVWVELEFEHCLKAPRCPMTRNDQIACCPATCHCTPALLRPCVPQTLSEHLAAMLGIEEGKTDGGHGSG